ncbi:polysaccharide biosynthesis C-terminal domain-containing protein [Lacticigenium naphthae]|uniref:polysaccharide biosynthesis C-terminal domain-containing protein n=1 Tax=Lacticigenium naphthae TaxID=515351 RepID=UPI000417C6D5|nr:polysaccharide biosynthesis C-terminal domain-containing protein [Lacticigenium naphthae]
MRSKQAFKSILSSGLLLAVTILTGFAVPRLMLEYFGSELNGLIASITQFLAYMVIMEAGLGGVIRAALYKPLADGNERAISSIIKATQNFFKFVGYFFVGYLFLLALIYPYFVKESFDFVFTLSLVVIMGVNMFFRYYLGITYQILLEASQKKYITDIFQLITVLASTGLTIFLIVSGVSLHIIMLSMLFIYILHPFLLKWYVKNHYHLIRDISPDKTALKQKWDGFGHHVAYIVHINTDITLLTIFTNIKEVSVYAVYYMVVASVRNIVYLFSQGVDAAFGNIIAKQEKESLKGNFEIYEFLIFAITTIMFTATGILIIPFIKIYTSGIYDVNYIRPEFAVILILAEAIYCIRNPYNIVIKAAGHFRQTRNIAIIEAVINIIVSVIFVLRFGLTGVAIGTFSAMLYRTLSEVYYLSNEVIYLSIKAFIKKILVFSFSSAVTILIAQWLPSYELSTFSYWILYALQITILAISVTLCISLYFYKKELISIFYLFKYLVHEKSIN